MPIFKGKEFISPLQQHWHTPKLRVVFLSILWRSLPKDLFIFHSHWFLQNILFLQTWRKCLYLKVISLFLHFSSTDIHQNLELYSSLYYEGFPRGVCLYFIHTGFYNILFLKTWRKCLYLKVIEFVSPLQQHWHTPKLRVVFLSILWRSLPKGFVYISFTLVFTNILFLQTWRKCLYLKVISLFLHFSSTDIHQNLELYSSLYYEGFYLRDLFIFHSHWFLQHFIPKNMAKMPIFKGKEFVSPLQQHWHTPKLRVVFLSILWRFLPKGLFIFHSHWFLQHFIPTNMAKMPIFKGN